MTKLPTELHKNILLTITACLPVWHAEVHIKGCKEENGVTYQEGAAAVDGEESERQWSMYNPAAYYTREMGEMTCMDFLDDKMDWVAHQKNISQGTNFHCTHFALRSSWLVFALPKKALYCLQGREGPV